MLNKLIDKLSDALGIDEKENETTSVSGDKPKLYALIVGINQYHVISHLTGCVNDATFWKNYLESDLIKSRFDVDVLPLFDAKATKANIVKGFQEHLTQAGAGDTAFFFFAGHGAQEKAHPAFYASEPDRKLEILICDDPHRNPLQILKSGEDLADKELRWLISQVAKNNPHIVTIFDCCHSGDNTRYMISAETTDEEATRQLRSTSSREGDLKEQREWNRFIFSKHFQPEDIEASSLSALMPEGDHVQLSACRSREPAKENRRMRRGYFTLAMERVLKRNAANPISYYDLMVQVKQLIRNLSDRRVDQIPQYHFKSRGGNAAYGSFLSGKPSTSVINRQVFWDKTDQVWKLRAGAIDGIIQGGNSPSVVKFTHEEQSYIAQIKELKLQESVLDFAIDPPQGFNYKAKVEPTYAKPLRIAIKGNDTEGLTAFTSFIEQAQIRSLYAGYLHFVSENEAYDYAIHANKSGVLEPKELSIIRNGEEHPLTRQSYGYDDAACRDMLSDLKQIAQWEFLKRLHNTKSVLNQQKPIDVELIIPNVSTGDWEVHPMTNEPFSIRLDDIINPRSEAKLKVQLRNESGKTYHVALLYLSEYFEVYPELLEQGVWEFLGNHEPVQAIGGDAFTSKITDRVRGFNLESWTERFLLIASTDPFAVAPYKMEELPEAIIPGMRGDEGDGNRGSMSFGRKSDTPTSDHDWYTQLIEVNITNPYFKAGLNS